MIVTGERGPNEYGISESALALLRTLERDHSPKEPVAERLIFHGCGTILMMGCPIGIDWRVEHQGDRVLISDVVRYDTTNPNEGVRFVGLHVMVPLVQYQREVVAFARKAKEPFEGTQKRFYEEWEQDTYEEFWREYEILLAKHDSTKETSS